MQFAEPILHFGVIVGGKCERFMTLCHTQLKTKATAFWILDVHSVREGRLIFIMHFWFYGVLSVSSRLTNLNHFGTKVHNDGGLRFALSLVFVHFENVRAVDFLPQITISIEENITEPNVTNLN